MEENALNNKCEVLLIGGSAGSLEVLSLLLPQLNQIYSFSIFLILHRKSASDTTLENLIALKTKIPLEKVEDKVKIKRGHIYVAPSDYHLLFEKNNCLSLDVSEKVNYSRPSIDVSFESAAVAFGRNCTAMLLSGANSDGSLGLKAVQHAGGTVVIQNPENAIMPFMPQSAVDIMTPNHIFEISDLVNYINEIDSSNKF